MNIIFMTSKIPALNSFLKNFTTKFSNNCHKDTRIVDFNTFYPKPVAYRVLRSIDLQKLITVTKILTLDLNKILNQKSCLSKSPADRTAISTEFYMPTKITVLLSIKHLFASDPPNTDSEKDDQWANTFLGKNIWNKDDDRESNHQFFDNYDQQQSLGGPRITTLGPMIEMIAGSLSGSKKISTVSSSLSHQNTGNGRTVDDTVIVPFESPAYLHCRIRNRGSNEVVWIRLSDEKILTVGTETFTDDKRFQLSYRNEPSGLEDMLLIIRSSSILLENRFRYTQLNDSGSYECQIPADRPYRLIVKLTVLGGNALESQMIGDRPVVEKRERSALVNNDN
uniref:Ig-like domain-containing protein n=1 Tax=Romanomermis culicivorax TaxID=13658 RepID=A0A915HGW1_ROMCU